MSGTANICYLSEDAGYTEEEMYCVGLIVPLKEGKLKGSAMKLFEMSTNKPFPKKMPIKIDYNSDTASLGPLKGPVPTREERRRFPF